MTRLAAVVVLLGQLQSLPAAAACAQMNAATPPAGASCHQAAPAPPAAVDPTPSGPALAAPGDGSDPFCPQMPCCVAQAGAALRAEAASLHVLGVVLTVFAADEAAPVSHSAAPSPPPPQG